MLEILLAHLRHQREGVPDGLHRRVDVVEAAQVLALVVEFQLEGHPVAEQRGGEVVDVVEVVFVVGGVRGVVEGVHVGNDVADPICDGAVVVRAEVLQVPVVALEADFRCQGGDQLGEVVEKVFAGGVE